MSTIMFESMNVVLIAFSLIGLPANAEVTLVQDGRAVAVIVLPDQPTADEKIAAEDFQLHIRLMSGATLPIVAETDRPDRFARLYLGSYHRLSRYVSLKRSGKNPSNIMLERIRKGWSEAIAVMKDPTMPGIIEGGYRVGEFVRPLENMLRYVQVQGELVFGPRQFGYVDNLTNDTQVILVSRVFKGFAPGVNMPLRANGSGEVIW